MNLKIKLYAIIAVLICVVLPLNSLGQERKIIPLNEHFFPIENEGEGQNYSKIVTISPEGELVEKIYSLEYSLVSITKSIFEEGQPREPLWEEKQHFHPNGELKFTQLRYRKNNEKHTKIFVGEDLILDLECSGSSKCKGKFVSSLGYEEMVDRDIFKPSFPTLEVWQKFLTRNMTYPLAARDTDAEAEIWVGMNISEFGEILERKIVNESEAHPSLIKEVENIIGNYDGEVVPARNIEGDYISAWMYFPVRFLLD